MLQIRRIQGPDCGTLWAVLEDMVREAMSAMWGLSLTWLLSSRQPGRCGNF
jgi:hypothetical protein